MDLTFALLASDPSNTGRKMPLLNKTALKFSDHTIRILQTCMFLHEQSEVSCVPVLAGFCHLSPHSQCVVFQVQILILFHQEWYWCPQQCHEEWLPS